LADLLILAHAETWECRFQVSALAASSAAVGQKVELALFFAALASWVEGRWDALDPAPPLTAERLVEVQAPSLTAMLEDARATGHLRLYACSASMHFLALDPARVQARVDAVLGWQTFSAKIAQAGRVVTL
jgi:predicted peroxiredoxin